MAYLVKWRIEGTVVIEDDEADSLETARDSFRQIALLDLFELVEGEPDAVTIASIETAT
jgi:hypothetical protein